MILPCGCPVDPVMPDCTVIPAWELELLHSCDATPVAAVRPLWPLLWEGDQG